MSGITNRPEPEEQENQARVQEKAQQLPADERVPTRDGPVGKDRGDAADDPGRLSETGIGRGLEHKGH